MSWIPVLQIATNIGTPLALAGFAFTILFFILKQLISSRLLRQVTRDQTFTIIMSIVNVLFWLSVLSLIAGTTSYLFKVSLGSPILHVRPSVTDSFLSWQNGNFNPYPEHGDDPFAIKIKNIGTGNAINLTITFSLSIDADELARTALKSDLFLGRNITGDVKKLTVPTRSMI